MARDSALDVPFAIAIITFCGYYPSSRWIADLLGGPDEGRQAESR